MYACQANAIIHRGTLSRDVNAGRASKKLLLSICAISSRFLEPGNGRRAPLQGSSQAQAWAREAKTMLILDDDLTTETVATALILAKHDNNSGRYTQAFILSSMASRMAMALGLHKELPSEHHAGTAERETRRRLMWGCYCLERMMHTGIPEFILTQASSISVRLPCDDYQYLLGIPREMEYPNLETGLGPGAESDCAGDRESVGLLALYVELMGIRTMILR